MARGRVGGTRSKIRGAIGSEIYYIGKNDAGRTTQVVTARPEARAYSNTPAQAKNRCIMGQIHRMFHLLPQIIRQGYHGIPEGTLSFQHFAKINYPLLKKDFETNFEWNSEFSWSRKYSMIPPAGPWILIQSDIPAFPINGPITGDALGALFDFETKPIGNNRTYGDLCNALNLSLGDILHVYDFLIDNESGVQMLVDFTYLVNPNLDLSKRLADHYPIPMFITDWCYYETWDIDYETGVIRFVLDDGDLYEGLQPWDIGIFVEHHADGKIYLSSCQFQNVTIRTLPRYDHVPPEFVFDTWLEYE